MGIHDFLWGGSDKEKYKESFYNINTASSSGDYTKQQQKLSETESTKPVFAKPISTNHGLPSLNSLREPVNRVIPIEDIERLRLASQAMWELLRDKHGLTDTDIEDKIQEIDLRDGVDDDQMTITMIACPACGKQGRSYRRVCLYCGASIPKPEVFSK